MISYLSMRCVEYVHTVVHVNVYHRLLLLDIDITFSSRI